MFFLCISLHLLNILARRFCKGKLPPGPTSLPIVGNLFELGHGRPNESLAQLAKIYGPLMSLQLGYVSTLVVTSPNMAKEVLRKNDQACSGRAVPDALRALDHNQASLAFSQPNSHWRQLRTICNTQIFTTLRLQSSQGLRLQKVNDLIAYIARNCEEGIAVDIGKAAFTCSLNLISNTVFSIDLVDPGSESAQEFKELMREIISEIGRINIGDYFPLLRTLDLQGIRRRMAAHFKKLHLVFEGLVQQRLISRAASSSPRKNDFLDVLLDRLEDGDFKFDIKALLVDLFSGGTETSSNVLEWAMAELLRNPDIMRKVRDEISQTIRAGQQVKESDIARLPYLQAVVKETLRLHPPVPLLIPHRAESDLEICGFTIPKNTQILVNVWAIGRDPDLWPDPVAFTPERFLESQIDFKGQIFKLIPFGAGRRICPGLPLAYRMLHLMLGSLLHSFSWELPDGMLPKDMDMSDKFGSTLQKAVPLRAVPMQD